MRLNFLSFFLVAWAFPEAFALYDEDSAVITLTSEDFTKQVIGSDDIWVVEFFAPWCGHCQEFAPKYEKAAEELSKFGIKVGALNVEAEPETDPGAKSLQNVEGVNGFPTIKLYSGPSTPNPYAGGRYTALTEVFKGKRTTSELKRAALKMFPRESVTQIKSVEDFGKVGSALKGMTGEHAEAMKQMKAAVLFTEKKSTSSLLLSLAYSMMPRLIVAMVNSELDEVTSHFGVEDFPSFVMVDPVTAPETGEILDTFSGDIKDRDAILAWMEEFALDIKVGEPEADPAADTQSEGVQWRNGFRKVTMII